MLAYPEETWNYTIENIVGNPITNIAEMKTRNILEKKILSFYASRELILKKDVEPSASKAFLLINAGLCFAIALEFFVGVFLGWNFSSERFLAVWVLTPILIILLDFVVKRRKKLKRRKSKAKKTQKDSTVLQKSST